MRDFKDKVVTIRLSAWHKNTLEKLASVHGLGLSEYIRRMIEFEYQEWKTVKESIERKSEKLSTTDQELKKITNKLFNKNQYEQNN